MAGHSHWAGIKHRKAVVDARKGKLFSKIARDIMVAARDGGGDPESNLRLKYALEKAREVNMPKENIERAIKKGLGELPGESLESVNYEGYALGGVAILVESLTDNRNRTTSEVRKLFEKFGGKLGEAGCVSWLFQVKGLITVPVQSIEEDELLEIALELGVEDLETRETFYEIRTEPEDFIRVRNALKEREVEMDVAEVTKIPVSTVQVDDQEGRKVLGLIEALDEHDDIQQVYSNFEVSEQLITELSES